MKGGCTSSPGGHRAQHLVGRVGPGVVPCPQLDGQGAGEVGCHAPHHRLQPLRLLQHAGSAAPAAHLRISVLGWHLLMCGLVCEACHGCGQQSSTSLLAALQAAPSGMWLCPDLRFRPCFTLWTDLYCYTSTPAWQGCSTSADPPT